MSGLLIFRLLKFLPLFCLVVASVSAVAGGQLDTVEPAIIVTETTTAEKADIPKQLQAQAITNDKSPFGYWGTEPDKYTGWKSHSNRLIPVYAFGTKSAGAGVDLTSYFGTESLYRSQAKVQALYGYVPEKTVNPNAVWMDQTNIFDMQAAAAAAGKKYIFLVVFDGMDWQTTRAAAIWNQKKVAYTEGRGQGTHFQTFDASGTAQFGFMVTSAHNEGTDVDVDKQSVKNPGGTIRGGYDAASAGNSPWAVTPDPGYLIAKPKEGNPKHAYTDSSSSATSMTAGIKTFNGAINVDAAGAPVPTIAHLLQEKGWRVGAVSSVPISHATPASAYAHNVSRDDYQDLTRDMLGLPSISHPDRPLLGLDVVIGGGFGNNGDPKKGGESQGKNYVQGNIYLTDTDLAAADIRHGGQYVTAVRTAGQNGTTLLQKATESAIAGRHRLFGFFGVGQYNGHLPFATADRRYDPVPGGNKKAEQYTAEDLTENPTLVDMTRSAIQFLASDRKPFWLMVESGDVDWANHDNNIDNSIGAVNSGDDAVRVITDWVEANSDWNESLVIVTADHGHLLNLVKPELLVGEQAQPPARPPVVLTPEAEKIHHSGMLFDGHNDLPWEIREKGNSSFDNLDISKDQPSLHTDLARLRKGGVKAQFWSVYVPAEFDKTGDALSQTLHQISIVKAMVRRYPETFEFASTADDLVRIVQSGKIASMMGVEGGYSIENEISNLQRLYNEGCRYMTLTHSKSLTWADSATDAPKVNGLSNFGREVVLEMNRLGMIVDLSHVSPETMRQSIVVSKAPVMFSHSSARAICDHPRNVPDDVLQLVTTNGGVVMVNFFSAFIAPTEELRINKEARGTLHDVVDHIDHLVKVAGIDHVGIGSDFDGVPRLPEQLESVATYPLITQELLNRGYDAEGIHKILGGNMMRVLREAERVSKAMN